MPSTWSGGMPLISSAPTPSCSSRWAARPNVSPSGPPGCSPCSPHSPWAQRRNDSQTGRPVASSASAVANSDGRTAESVSTRTRSGGSVASARLTSSIVSAESGPSTSASMASATAVLVCATAWRASWTLRRARSSQRAPLPGAGSQPLAVITSAPARTKRLCRPTTASGVSTSARWRGGCRPERPSRITHRSWRSVRTASYAAPEGADFPATLRMALYASDLWLPLQSGADPELRAPGSPVTPGVAPDCRSGAARGSFGGCSVSSTTRGRLSPGWRPDCPGFRPGLPCRSTKQAHGCSLPPSSVSRLGGCGETPRRGPTRRPPPSRGPVRGGARAPTP